MVKIILIYTNKNDYDYTYSSLVENCNTDYSLTILAKEKIKIDNTANIVYFKSESNFSKILNEIIKQSEDDFYFVIKTGVYFTEDAFEPFIHVLEDEEVGVAVPKLNSPFPEQTHLFSTVLPSNILLEAGSNNRVFDGETAYIKDIDDNFIVFSKNAFEKIGGFDENLKELPVIYKDFLLSLFKNGLYAKVCKDSLVFTTNISDSKAFETEDMSILNKKLGIDTGYYSGVRSELFQFINESPFEGLNILEIGCGAGYTLLALKNMYENANLYGIEIVNACSQIAPPCADIKFGDCMTLIDEFEDESLDYILCPDVLEHLVDPWELVRKCHKKLIKGGKLIASIPNANHISVLSELLNGNFSYKSAGILDSTHLRFFTINTMISLFAENGYTITQVSGVQSGGPAEGEFIKDLLDSKLVNKDWKHPVDLQSQLSVLQFHLVCVKGE